MKALNNIQFVVNAAEEMASYKSKIRAAEDYDTAKHIAYQAIGYLNCMITYLNTMICFENNDFTGDLDETIDDWRKNIFQALIDMASKTEQPSEIIWKLCRKRDGQEN